MSTPPGRITLDEWNARYTALQAEGLCEPSYGGNLRRHVEDGDFRLLKLRMDNSPAALRLWNFLLTEEDRLAEARANGRVLVGAMKDLGTVPVMAYAFENVTAFYPDGAWWIPCVMEQSAGLLQIADSLGVDDSFCPVRALLGAFVNRGPFPDPRIADMQRRGDVRRFFGHRPAPGGNGTSGLLVGDSPSPKPGRGGGGGRPARRVLRPALPSRLRRERTGAGPRRVREGSRHSLDGRGAPGRNPPRQPRPRPAAGTPKGRLHRRIGSPPRPRGAHRRNAGDPLLLRPGGVFGRSGGPPRRSPATYPRRRRRIIFSPRDAVRVLLGESGCRFAGDEYAGRCRRTALRD